MKTRGIINSMYDLLQFFSTSEKPVTVDEFLAFWTPLSTEEIQYFTFAQLG